MLKFQETQQIDPSLKAILVILFIVCMALNVFINIAFFTGTLICFVFSIIAFMLRLDVYVYDDRIEYKLFPFHKSNRVTMLNSIKQIEIMSSNQLCLFGLKIKNTPSGAYYHLGGDTIIRIKTKEGKVIWISTQKSKEIEQVFENIECLG